MTIQEEIESLKKEKAKLEVDMKKYEEKVFLENEITKLKHNNRVRKIKKRLGIFRVWGVIFKFCWKVIKGIFVSIQNAIWNYQTAMVKQSKELEKKQGEKKE